ncbi:MAG TPA: DUF72 domain-containing protein [Dehalococcoidia bacterium]|nr:DUF72 domain-containing protein [Dehalococcoidia bacterium]
MARLRIGTCSWTDKPLIESGAFYPRHVRGAEALLRYYGTQFDLVEVDSTYYGIPLPRNAEQWVERTPEDFQFDVKAFRLFTLHQTPVQVFPRDIRDALPPSTRRSVFYADIPTELRDELWRRFLDAVQSLVTARKLGVVLLQFPPWVEPAPHFEQHIADCSARLEGVQVAVEFRHRGWLVGEQLERTLAFLDEHRLAFVAVDSPQGFESSLPPIATATAPVAVVRFHGRNTATWAGPSASSAERFDWWYTDEELAQWVPRIEELMDRAQEVHLLMNTNNQNQGPENAQRLRRVLEQARLL